MIASASAIAPIGSRSRDPIGYVDSFGLHGFIKQNPLKYLDPAGLCGETCPGPKFRGKRNHKIAEENFANVAPGGWADTANRYIERLIGNAGYLHIHTSRLNARRDFYGESGFAIGVKGQVKYDAKKGCCNFSGNEIFQISFFAVYDSQGFKNRYPTKMRLPNGLLVDGPQTVEAHEMWHLDGVPDQFCTDNPGLVKKRGINC